ncbi:NAC_domain-containing protein [Hexamita inflata]|uniref:NAC domain-containing protein n=1 Tax=Hexamita inflata TaxID=28002 RepID=A0AA86N9B3_9EUKA|nr:NAC domain-containing protein [Hexamita inflata]
MAPKVNKNQINAEEQLLKLGAKRVDTATKVSFYRGDLEFQIQQPKVFYNEATQTYYVIGEPRHQDYNEQAQQLMSFFQNNMKNQPMPAHQHGEGCGCGDHEGENAEAYTEDDIKTVMEQGNVDEAKAKALLEEHKDVVNAVLACQNQEKK